MRAVAVLLLLAAPLFAADPPGTVKVAAVQCS